MGGIFIVLIVIGFIVVISLKWPVNVSPLNNSVVVKEVAEKTKDTMRWASEKDLIFLGYYKMQIGVGSGFMAAWESDDAQRFVCHYLMGNMSVVDIVSEFESGCFLTTGSSKSGWLYPKLDGLYMQTMDFHGVDEYFNVHLEMEGFLRANGAGGPLKAGTYTLPQAIKKYISKEYINDLKHFYRYLIMPYYFIFTKIRFHNKTIAKQVELNLVKLPNKQSRKNINENPYANVD